jgi:hypothetical protein
MWFLVVAAGVMIAVGAMLLTGPARRAGHPRLGSFGEWIPLPVLGAAIFFPLGLAHHETTWTLTWLAITYAAWLTVSGASGNLAGRARRAGRPRLAGFTESASLPVSVSCLWASLELALHQADWATLVVFPLAFAVSTVWIRVRRRRSNA